MTREEAIKWIEEHNNPFLDETKDSQAHRLALDALRQPQIVRCKDCKFYWEENEFCYISQGYTKPEHFCGWGKRKEGDGE